MHEYRVVERWAQDGRCALRCNRGQFHVARALHVMPPLEACLQGDKPRLGFGILLCADSGAIFRVIFESIDDSQAAELEREQAWTPTLERPSVAMQARDN